MVRFLERRGHTVHEASEGGQALVLLSASSVEYDVIVSDLRMPGLGGEELLRRLQDQGRGMARRIVILTRDTASPATLQMFSEARVVVLAKPIGGADIVRVVEQIAATALN